MAEGLRKAGHDAIHVRDLGLASATDHEILIKALAEERIIVSADTDFGTLLALSDLAKPSFILFRRTDKRPVSLLMHLLANLSQTEKALNKGATLLRLFRRSAFKEQLQCRFDTPSLRGRREGRGAYALR